MSPQRRVALPRDCYGLAAQLQPLLRGLAHRRDTTLRLFCEPHDIELAMAYDFDLFVIGGGSGGVRAARVAAQTGARVAIAEQDRYGGTCVIRGCVPKKLMVFASEFGAMIDDARSYGWRIGTGDFDWQAFKPRLHAELDRLESIYRDILARKQVRNYDCRATLIDGHTVLLADGERKTAGNILLAMGGHPTRPDIPGAELAITSNEVFHLSALPKRILIVGAGYIGCEFACILRGMGVEVHVWHRGDRILRGFDAEASNLVAEQMQANGIMIEFGRDVCALHRAASGTRVEFGEAKTGEFDQVLFATGRAPNTADMGLAEAGVKLGRHGAVVVNRYAQTSLPSVHAVGDVTDRLNLTPVAIRDGMAYVETVFKDNPTGSDHACVPIAVFTQPELGSVGLSEEDARAQGPIMVYASRFRPMRTAFAGRTDEVLMKLVVGRDNRRVLGCQIVAPGAGELIQLAAIAVKMSATKEDFDRTVAVHPTIAEELVTISTAIREY